MPRKTLLLMLLLALGFMAGASMMYVYDAGPERLPARTADDAPAPRDDSLLEEQLARVQEALAQATEERAWLMQRLASLEAQLADLDSRPEPDTPVVDAAADAPPDPRAPAEYSGLEALTAAGIPADQAAAIQARLDAWDLERLQLQDRATREGWQRTPRYYKAARALQEAFKELRPEIGEDSYDRLLYALGRSNRVEVRDVMQYSAAEQAGLRAGDRLIAYAGQRVFNTPELTALTAEGTAGEPVLVRIERAGELQELYLPRGPLGIRLAPGRQAPQ
jgi:hypothetical protein